MELALSLAACVSRERLARCAANQNFGVVNGKETSDLKPGKSLDVRRDKQATIVSFIWVPTSAVYVDAREDGNAFF